MKFKTPLTKRRQLARDLEAKFKRQLELLAEMAAVYVAKGVEVPQEVAQTIGAVEHRRRAFIQVNQVLVGTTSGLGVEKIVKTFLESIENDNQQVMALVTRALTPDE